MTAKIIRFDAAARASLLRGGMVYYRGPDERTHAVTRDEFAALAGQGTVTAATEVFDTAAGSAGEWRERFERPAGESLHRTLI